jgi:hypothetical protein
MKKLFRILRNAYNILGSFMIGLLFLGVGVGTSALAYFFVPIGISMFDDTDYWWQGFIPFILLLFFTLIPFVFFWLSYVLFKSIFEKARQEEEK